MALRARREPVDIDVSNDYAGEQIWAVQGEVNSLILDMCISQGGLPINFADTDITFRYRRADGLIGKLVLGEDDGITLQEKDGHIEVLLPADTFKVGGTVDCEFIITDELNSITVKTPIFKLFVIEAIEI